jgi:hypothetical protein
MSSKIVISNLSIDLSKLQAPLATTNFTMASTATDLCLHGQGRQVAAVAMEMVALMEAMAA